MRVLTANETRIKILDLLEENNITIKDLNDKIGASGLNLYKFLSGKTQSIHADTLAAIALGLGVSCDDLLTDSTGERVTATRAADYLGLSESSVRFIRSLSDAERSGLDAAMSKRARVNFRSLLQFFGSEVLDPITEGRDYMMFLASRAVCSILDRL